MTTDTVNGSPSEVNLLQRLALITGVILAVMTFAQIIESLRVNYVLLVIAWASYALWWVVVTRTPDNESAGEKAWAWINLGLAVLLLLLVFVSPNVSLGWPDGIVWPLWMWVVVAVAAALAVLAALNSSVDWLAAFAVAAAAVLLIWAVAWLFGVGNDFDGVIGSSDKGTSGSSLVVVQEDVTGISFDCDAEITNGIYPSRADNLVSPASGPSMADMSAEELFDEICNRMSTSEVQRAFYPGALVPELTLYGDSLSPHQLNLWPAALSDDDSLSEAVVKRFELVVFDAEFVSQDALGGEDYKILTIDPASSEDRPVIMTMANFKMPVGGMNLWKLTPVRYGDSTLDEVSASFFEPSLGIFFIPRGMEVDAHELDGEIDLGEIFGSEDEAEDGEAAAETTTSVAPDGTVTTVVENPDGTVTTTVTTPDGESSTTVTTPTSDDNGGDQGDTGGNGGSGGSDAGDCGSNCGSGGGGDDGCEGDCNGGGATTSTTCDCPTTTVPPTTTTTVPPTTTTTVPPTTTTQPPTTTTTVPPTTTTQPPTTTTTVPPEQPDFKPQLVGSGPWTFQLQLGNASDWCGFVTQDGKVIAPGSTISESDLYVHGNGDKWLWVTGTPCNGTPTVRHKTNTVIWGY